MDPILKELVDSLPSSATELTEDNIKKIHEYIPVPRDHRIIWADISSFGGYPAGIVVTDRALITKAPKADVKEKNRFIKKENKGKETADRAPLQKVAYRMINWEYFKPDDYSAEASHESSIATSYALTSDGEILARFNSQSLCQLFVEYRATIESLQATVQGILESATFSAFDSVNVEGVMFNAAYGEGQSSTGHGIYAEEAGALLDKLNGAQSAVAGRDNAKNGPDKIVNGSPVQCKYHKTASASVNSCFKTNRSTGTREFRYYDLSNNPMKIEVASDQYTEAVACMKARIEKGQVKGVSDPNKAYDIIRKGNLSYKQARNLAKAGNIDSLRYDAATGAVTCLSALGISSLVAFATVFWNTKDPAKAARYAIATGLRVYGLSFAGGIIASQLARTSLMNSVRPLATGISKSLNPKTVQAIINSFRALAGKKAIYGAAAQRSFAKFLGSNMITECVMLVAFAIPDTYKRLEGKVSTAQYAKNMASLFSSFVGAIAGTAFAGAMFGKKLTDPAHNKWLTAASMAAGTVLGGLTGGAVKAFSDLLHEDDSVITTRMFNAVLVNVVFDNLLSEDEQKRLFDLLDKDSKGLSELQVNLLNAAEQESMIRSYLEPLVTSIVKERKTINEEDEIALSAEMNDIILRGELENEM